MKTILASFSVVLMGAATGWHWESAKSEQRVAVPKKETYPSQKTADAFPDGPGIPTDASVEDWRSWAVRIERAESSEDLETIFEELAGSDDKMLKTAVSPLLGARWVEINPAAGLDFLGSAEMGKKVFIPLLEEWFLIDQKAALDAMAGFQGPPGSYPYESVLKRLVIRDPDACLDFMRITRKHVHYPENHRWAILARARPDEYAKIIVDIETENLKRGERYSAYSHVRLFTGVLAGRDPEAALEWANGLYGRIRGDAVSTVLNVWAGKDPETVIQKLAEWKEDPSGNPYKGAMGSFLDYTLARALARKGDLDTAALWLEKNSFRTETFIETAALEIAKGEMSFEDVFDTLKSVDSYGDKVRTGAFRGMWDRMTNDELLNAFDVLKGKPSSGQRAKAIGGLLRETMTRDPAKATELARRLPSNPTRHEAIREMFRDTELERQDRVAEAMVSTLTPEDAAVAIGALFDSEPRKPGREILTFDTNFYVEALSAAPPSKARTKAAVQLALHWGAFDPVAAMEWAENLPGDEAVAATAAAAQGWAPHDAYALSNHLLEMPTGPTRDAATSALVEAVREAEPDSAWVWATSIGDPSTGGNARHAVIESWAAKHPEEARAAIDSTEGLSAAERNTLREIIEK